ncbi:MAG TPA: invasion associated locus B family protein [Rhizomicrobium sp.]|jgi:hypothetical protein
MRIFATSLAIALISAPAWAAPDTTQVLGSFQTWAAYSAGSGEQKVCYAMASPKASVPKKKRDKNYFMISDWPNRPDKAKGEIEIWPGYKYKEDSKVTLQVGAAKFTLFAKNDGDNGTAWVKDLPDEQPIINAMRAGSTVVVTGISSRGTTIKDTFPLAGLPDALQKAHDACGL